MFWWDSQPQNKSNLYGLLQTILKWSNIFTFASYGKVLVLWERSLLEFPSNLYVFRAPVRKYGFYERVCMSSVC